MGKPMEIDWVNKTFDGIAPGDNLLVRSPYKMSLLKFENIENGPKSPNQVMLNRRVIGVTIPALTEHLIRKGVSDATDIELPRKRPKEVLRCNILGTHKLDFMADPSLGIHLVSSNMSTDLFLDLAIRYDDGSLETMAKNGLEVVTHDETIREYLHEVTLPGYFASNVEPFLDSSPTDLQPPTWKLTQQSYGLREWINLILHKGGNRPLVDYDEALIALRETMEPAQLGDFVYVGSQEEVYLMGVSEGDNGEKPYMQGTYVTSSRPILFFSNNYLGGLSVREVELFESDPKNYSHVAQNRPPEFKGRPFVFTAIDRSQNCKNTIFQGRPELITTDNNAALDHFRSTGFAELTEIVEQYARGPSEAETQISTFLDRKFFY